jgi:hypothetical protein
MGARDVSIPGIAGRVTVSQPGLWRGAQILVDGAPVKKGGWGKLLLQRADGSTVEARLADHLTRTVPSIRIGAEKYEFGDPVPVLQLVFALLPIGLIVIGGGLGGLCGGVAFFVTQGITRSAKPASLKLALMFGVTLGAAAVYFVLASLLYAATH